MSQSKPQITAPKVYGYLTVIQAGTAAVFSTFLITHLSAPALAVIGGIDLTNKTIILGRVYYQHKLLEPFIVLGALAGHVVAGIAKRTIKLYWKYKKRDDVRKLMGGEIRERVEQTTTDEKDDQGKVVRQKITTTTITTISGSPISRATSLLLPSHHTAGYILIPLVFGHVFINRVLPKQHFGDSSLINATYVTLSLQKWPRLSYFALITLIGLTSYHVISGAPATNKILRSYLFKKNSERQLSEPEKKRQRILKSGITIASVGLLTTGLLVIGGKFGKDPKIPLRTEYLKVYGQVYPQSW